MRTHRAQCWYTDLSSLSVLLCSVCPIGVVTSPLPNAHLMSRQPCQHTVRMKFALPFCWTCCFALRIVKPWVCALSVCLFVPHIHPVSSFYHPYSPLVYVFSPQFFVIACPIASKGVYLVTREHRRERVCMFVFMRMCVCVFHPASSYYIVIRILAPNSGEQITLR